MVENAFREAYNFPELDFEYQKDVIKSTRNYRKRKLVA